MFVDGSTYLIKLIAGLSGRVAALAAIVTGTNYYGFVNDGVTSSFDYLSIIIPVGSSFDYGNLI
jgi:hypothetical protein